MSDWDNVPKRLLFGYPTKPDLPYVYILGVSLLEAAQARQIDVVLVAELSRWGRSTLDLLHTLKELEARRVSVIAMSGLAFDLTTPHGRMPATIIAGIADFERELIQERIRSGIAAAKARGKRLGRQKGQRPKSGRLAPRVLALVEKGAQLPTDWP